MFSRRITMAALSALLLSALTIGPAAAAKPTPPANGGGERPPTAAERAASDRKVAAANAYLAGIEASGQDLVTLACPTPTVATTTAVTTATTTTTGATQACTVPQGYLGVEARDQIFGHYCGPAVGQVIANYSWAMGSGRNVFTQQQLAGWMRTDVNGGTSSWWMAAGLETATRGAPRRPAVWQWVVTGLGDTDRDGHTGDELQGFVRSNVSGSKMPLAFSLKPHDPNSRYYLISWPRPVWSVGHWIGIYGWYGSYNGTDFSRIYYTDSSRDEGGSTGKYWDPTRDVAAMIMEHTRVFVW